MAIAKKISRSFHNRERRLPPAVAVVLDDIVAGAMRRAEAHHAQRAALAEAAAELRDRRADELARVAERLGVADVVRTLAAAQHGLSKAAISAIEKAQVGGQLPSPRRKR